MNFLSNNSTFNQLQLLYSGCTVANFSSISLDGIWFSSMYLIFIFFFRNMKIDKEVFPAGTDSRYLRKVCE